jgi:hypothetical protein
MRPLYPVQTRSRAGVFRRACVTNERAGAYILW